MARSYGQKGYFAGGASDNRIFFSSGVNFSASIDEVTEMLLFDPQTSGGLLIACPSEKLDEFISEANKLKQQFWVIGHAESGKGIQVD